MYKCVFEDDNILIVDKERNISVHPGAGNKDNSLMDLILSSGKYGYLGIINRIDKDTSGLVLIAKDGFTHMALEEKMKAYEIKRKYVGFVYGIFDLCAGKIETKIIRSNSDKTTMVASSTIGKDAVTLYKVLNSFFSEISFLEYQLKTGRTHQIRVHMRHNKTPVIGDHKYSKGLSLILKETPQDVQNLLKSFRKQMLHSKYISFEHPVTNHLVEVEAHLPDDMKILLDKLIQVSH
ncbi:RluA family pseudouridine synthase [Candidatus Cyrtobacter comes]|uniref:Pseudouridine synthase n=1 Tax=Candidatus Cyrtobacter comes TaxID=675776 RepID=A0ABU5L7H5_9RICK|nr:RluA family pseudouridine synthase [Candidatus Cyrtobacter comes]MDZ5762083.1 RluA family pseudouridine synthase [Candidatus Cyrtobacter comes]